MEAEDLFGDLPPPSHQPPPSDVQQPFQQPQSSSQKEPKKSVKILSETPNNNNNNNNNNDKDNNNKKDPYVLPPAPLKSALKRPKPCQQPTSPPPPDGGSERRLRFKTTTDASITQIIEAMQKIASHINNPAKFSKASKLAIQLIQAGSVKPETADHFFAILEAAMLSPTSCDDTSVRTDYHSLFTAAQDARECLNKKQKNQLNAWAIHAVTANDLYTDDSFVFSKAAGRVKDFISHLPVATEEEDAEEAAGLKDEKNRENAEVQTRQDTTSSDCYLEDIPNEESDPFGLDALISSKPRKDDKARENKGREEAKEMKGFLKLQREALINCLEIAAKRYKTPWCQTVIDILVKHAYDNISRFTARQREAIEKLWASIREQHNRRKQGKSVSGKLDVTGFEWLQEKYSHEKISIRHAVGGSGERKASQWLG